MPSLRTVLDLLSREELLSIVDAFQLQPQDRRAKANLVEAIAASESASLSGALGVLLRERDLELPVAEVFAAR